MTNVVVPKKQLVFFTGLAATGKRTTIDELVKQVSNAAKFEKDLVNNVFLPPSQSDTQQYKDLYPVINSKTYDLIIAQALDNLKGDTQKIAILQSYFGDKIVTKYSDLISSADYEVKIVYLHCSAAQQKERLLGRGLSRDGDKLLELRDPSTVTADSKDPYPEYRKKHLENHLRELARIPAANLLIVDTDDKTSLASNVANIIEFLQLDSPTLEVIPTSELNTAANNVPLFDAAFSVNAEQFKQLLAQIKQIAVNEVDAAALIDITSSNTEYETIAWIFNQFNYVGEQFQELVANKPATATPTPCP